MCFIIDPNLKLPNHPESVQKEQSELNLRKKLEEKPIVSNLFLNQPSPNRVNGVFKSLFSKFRRK